MSALTVGRIAQLAGKETDTRPSMVDAHELRQLCLMAQRNAIAVAAERARIREELRSAFDLADLISDDNRDFISLRDAYAALDRIIPEST